MTKINIGGVNKNDPYYRYKRDTIEIKTTNKKGGMTKITNINTILTQLQTRDKSKYINLLDKLVCKKLGVRAVKPNTYNAILYASDIEFVLEKLIDEYFLCPSDKCKKPEWNGSICKACGYGNVVKISKKLSIAPSVKTSKELALERLERKASLLANSIYDLRQNCMKKIKEIDAIDYYSIEIKPNSNTKKYHDIISECNSALEMFWKKESGKAISKWINGAGKLLLALSKEIG